MRNVLVVDGPPRSGKGSLIEDLLKLFFLPTLPMSLELKKLPNWSELEENSNKGILVPDEYVISALRAALLSMANMANDSVLLDGAVRTVGQADALLQICKEQGWKITVLALWASDEALRGRGEKRTRELIAKGEKPREDDKPEVFEGRLQTFKNETLPAIERLVDGGAERHKIYGGGTREEALQQTLSVLNFEQVNA